MPDTTPPPPPPYPWEGTPPALTPSGGHRSEPYAFYWNAFLLVPQIINFEAIGTDRVEQFWIHFLLPKKPHLVVEDIDLLPLLFGFLLEGVDLVLVRLLCGAQRRVQLPSAVLRLLSASISMSINGLFPFPYSGTDSCTMQDFFTLVLDSDSDSQLKCL